MDENICPLCTHSNVRPLRKVTERCRPAFAGEIVRCRNCGLARLCPLPSEEEIEKYYSGSDYLQGFADADVSMVTEHPETKPFLQKRIDELEALLGKPGRILDIGASTGTFLLLAREKGWAIDGIEMSDSTIDLAQSRHGIKLTKCSIEQAPFSDAQFDVVHASHVLEHVRDPNLFLQQCSRLLKPGGLLFIEVPSELGDLFAAFQRLILRRPEQANQVASPHLYYFTPQTLKNLVSSRGFQIQRVATPRRNKSEESRFPLGHVFKSMLYSLEGALRQGPLIELLAKKSSEPAL